MAIRDPIIQAEHLTALLPGRSAAKPTTALRDVSFTVRSGEFVAVIGSSGAGKTTLVRVLTGLVMPSRGTLIVNGLHVNRATPAQLCKLRREVATVPQQFNLIERTSALDNVLLGRLGFNPSWRTLLGLFPLADQQLCYVTLRELGLADKALERVDRLSGGERQRVAIARALVQRPQIVLADEPAASLDISLTRLVLEELRDLNRDRGVTILVNLHDLTLAKDYAARLLALRAGRLVFDGSPKQLSSAVQEEIYNGVQSEPARSVGPARQSAPVTTNAG